MKPEQNHRNCNLRFMIQIDSFGFDESYSVEIIMYPISKDIPNRFTDKEISIGTFGLGHNFDEAMKKLEIIKDSFYLLQASKKIEIKEI